MHARFIFKPVVFLKGALMFCIYDSYACQSFLKLSILTNKSQLFVCPYFRLLINLAEVTESDYKNFAGYVEFAWELVVLSKKTFIEESGILSEYKCG
jgi:hypothetical protein